MPLSAAESRMRRMRRSRRATTSHHEPPRATTNLTKKDTHIIRTSTRPAVGCVEAMYVVRALLLRICLPVMEAALGGGVLGMPSPLCPGVGSRVARFDSSRPATHGSSMLLNCQASFQRPDRLRSCSPWLISAEERGSVVHELHLLPVLQSHINGCPLWSDIQPHRSRFCGRAAAACRGHTALLSSVHRAIGGVQRRA
ncbi:hypothetical protein K466DRAFT_312881 [Polyporus arcularius HHB13444]|uniref:Uncharacterized protein n=1 Tax=Polyporus arcularius HHB13444 TaxID=1314778 RepID=A0A5C3P0I7_9APHY|nr:hypothetical protein K466DRAFT_312881 [Polyporus arcularius HHB13444]